MWAGERDIKSAGEGPSHILLLVHLLLGERDSLMVFSVCLVLRLLWWLCFEKNCFIKSTFS